MKQLTVVTATYNRAKYNIASIESILSQTYQNFHYIVINDGSTDDTKEVLDRFKHPNLTIIHQKNKGFTNTLVDVMQQIDTPYVALNDAGDISHPQRLEKQIALLESDESVGAVGCQIRIFSSDGQLLNTWVAPPYLKEPLPRLFKYSYFSHGDVMFRNWAYKKAGGYRRFFKYSQDYDLWLRIASFSKLARINDFLYDQIILPYSVLSDYRKGELQYLLCAFAVYLAKQRLEGKLDDLESKGEIAFEHFQNSLSQDVKQSISSKIMDNAQFNYRQTRNHNLLLEASQRAIEWNSKNPTALKCLKLTRFLSGMDKLGLQMLSQQCDRLVVNFINKRERKRISTELPSS